MRFFLTMNGIVALAACGGGSNSAGANIQSDTACATPPPACTAPLAGTFAILPVHNKTKQPMQLDGSEELLTNAMTGSGCFTVIERDKVQILIDEMKLCDDTNKDKSYFDCASFAQKGHILGITKYVFSDIVAAEPHIKGAELALKLPGAGGIDAGTSYGWIQLAARVVNVEDGKVAASTVVNAFVSDSQGGISVSSGGFDLKAAAYSKTAQGCALQSMLSDATAKLETALKP